MTDFGLNNVTTVRHMAMYHQIAQKSMKTPAAPFVLEIMSPNHAEIKIIQNVLIAQETLLDPVIIMHSVLIVLLWSFNATESLKIQILKCLQKTNDPLWSI